MKKYALFTIVFFTISSLFIGLGYSILQKEKVVLSATVNQDFITALNVEMEGRIKESGIPFHFSMLPPTQSNVDPIVFQTKDTTIHIEKDSSYKDGVVFTRQAHIIQTDLLAEGYPMHIQSVDSIFAENLSHSGFHIKTGIRYINNSTGEITDSKPGDKVYTSLSTPLFTLGLSKEIGVQGFFTLTTFSLFRKALLPFILLFIGWIIAIAGFSFLIFRKKENMEILYVHASETQKPTEVSPLIKISAFIYFDPKDAVIHYKENQYPPLSNQAAILFKSFLEATDYYLTNKEIDHIFWDGRDETRNVRSKAIQRLRNTLATIPELQIENVNSTGYQLQVTEE